MDEQALIKKMEDYFYAWAKGEEDVNHTVLVDLYELGTCFLYFSEKQNVHTDYCMMDRTPQSSRHLPQRSTRRALLASSACPRGGAVLPSAKAQMVSGHAH